MREIVFDTETTGVNREEDRLVEIGMVETEDKVPTGRDFHVYLNPGRPVDPEAVDVHGLTDAFLRDKPGFEEIAADMLRFVGDAKLVAHNAGFDAGFINNELTRHGFDALPKERFIDTLEMARKAFPGAKATLDALCKRFKVDATRRTKHGALLDAQLLSEVYIGLSGGRQRSLGLDPTANANQSAQTGADRIARQAARPRRKLVRATVSAEERARHRHFLAEKIPNAIWLERDQVDATAADGAPTETAQEAA